MKHIAAAAAATMLTLAVAGAAAAQQGSAAKPPPVQHAMHAAAALAHNTAAPRHTPAHNSHAHAISESRARHAALGAVEHGRVRSHRLEHQNGKLVYVYVITVPGQSGSNRVVVDATTGAIVSNEHRAAAATAAHARHAATHTSTKTATHHRR